LSPACTIQKHVEHCFRAVGEDCFIFKVVLPPSVTVIRPAAGYGRQCGSGRRVDDSNRDEGHGHNVPAYEIGDGGICKARGRRKWFAYTISVRFVKLVLGRQMNCQKRLGSIHLRAVETRRKSAKLPVDNNWRVTGCSWLVIIIIFRIYPRTVNGRRHVR